MNVVLWVVAGVLALVFFGSGLMKVVRSKEQLAAAGMGWADDFPGGAIKLIGGLEVLAGLGLILPAVFDVATVLVPLAALGLVVVMLGAIVVHARRREFPMVGGNVVLLLLAVLVVWGRFGPHAF